MQLLGDGYFFPLWVWNNIDGKERKPSLFLTPPTTPTPIFFSKAAEGQLTYFLSSATQEAPQRLIASLCLSPEACLILKLLVLISGCKGGKETLGCSWTAAFTLSAGKN